MNMYLIWIKIRLLVDFWYLCLDKLWVGRRSLSYRRTIPISQTTLICLSNSVCIKYCLFICIPKHWYWCYVSSPNRTNRVHAICQVLYLWRRYNRAMIAVKNCEKGLPKGCLPIIDTLHTAQYMFLKLAISHWPFNFTVRIKSISYACLDQTFFWRAQYVEVLGSYGSSQKKR